MQTEARRRKASGIEGIPPSEAVPRPTVQDSVDAYVQYWAKVFSPKPYNKDAAKTILLHADCSLGHRVNCWEIDVCQFTEMIASTPDSAPGPDGLPYSVWAAAPPYVTLALYHAYKGWLDYRPLPSDFGQS